MENVFDSATNVIILFTAAMFVVELVYPKIIIYLSLIPALVFKRPRTVLTHAFLHANVAHLFFNMLFLWVLGRHLERRIGKIPFIISYLIIAAIVGMLHAILCLTVMPEYAYVPALGASGAVMGILGMSVVYLRGLELYVILFPVPIPMRMNVKQLAITLFLLETIMAVTGLEPGIAHDAHIFGLIIGYVIARSSVSPIGIRIPSVSKKGIREVSVFRTKREPKYVREFYVYSPEDALCIKKLTDALVRLNKGKEVDPKELFLLIQTCDPSLALKTLMFLDREYLTLKEIKIILFIAILDTLIRAYETGGADVTFKRISREYLMDLWKYVDVRRQSAEGFWLNILGEKTFDTSVYKEIRGKFKEDAQKAYRISVSRLVSCPYYSVFYSEEYGSHYYLRGKLFEDSLISYAEKYLGYKTIERGKLVYALVELDERVKGYDRAIVHGFVDGIAERGGTKYIVEIKSTVGEPIVTLRLAQLSVYMRLYKTMTGEDVNGLLIAYIEQRDPPIAIRRVSLKEDMKKFIIERVKAFIRLEKKPIDKNVCAICPLKDRCEFRTGNPYRDARRFLMLGVTV